VLITPASATAGRNETMLVVPSTLRERVRPDIRGELAKTLSLWNVVTKILRSFSQTCKNILILRFRAIKIADLFWRQPTVGIRQL
jgi:hypothetical protein